MSVCKERTIQYLLWKYNTKQPGEYVSKEEGTKIKRNQRMKQKILIANRICNGFYMSDNQRERVIHIIKKIGDLQKLHRTLTKDEIIYIICYYIKQVDHYNFEPKKFKICNEYSYIKNVSFIKVLCNLNKIIK